MAELVVLAFNNEQGAYEMRDALLDYRQRRMLQLADAAVVVRQQDGRAQVKQLHSLVGTGALGGGFWGLFIGLMLAAPWLGLALGAAAGGAVGALTDHGVDDKFIREVGQTIEAGHSALFLLIHKADMQKLLEEMAQFRPTVLQTTLSAQDEAKLREAFGTG